ncbi:3-deoxy-7-phosphoheptulonate synthase [Streptomyces sp. WMMC897]|uniref:3-deoxy-7-phosphoheptulonate synthase n=1 Tax=Streptomyces sp. WMMC897 TaxID=3014782 RepID=UPI0022B66BE1|nr:3-deoxy-7-phosphoheptulonate synthase [Streptomyces sp. WMMC897]MCZ7416014.1 3-deoxy-7-phosphoheptulonate synthase [Streptomyces sp. WMMC897]
MRAGGRAARIHVPHAHDPRLLPAAPEPTAAAPVGSGGPELVSAQECDVLVSRLSEVARGRAFLLQCGDYTGPTAGRSADPLRDKLETLLQMSVVLAHAASVPVVVTGGLGHRPETSAATLNLIRAFARSAQAGLHQAHLRNLEFLARSPTGGRHVRTGAEIDRAMRFMRAYGADPRGTGAVEFFTGGEGPPLPDGAVPTCAHPATGRAYAASGHLQWVGQRAGHLDGAHVARCARLGNPVAVTLGPSVTADETLSCVDRLNPEGEPGRLTLVVGMGTDRVRDLLPVLVEKVTGNAAPVAWVCDPVHGNLFETPDGRRTCRFDDLVDELSGFFAVHRELGTRGGGVRVEFTGDDSAGCPGGDHVLRAGDPDRRGAVARAPRLNRRQALELAFLLGEMLRT